MENNYDKYTSATISKKLQEVKHVYIPIGATEAHSAHLPLSTDNNILEKYVELISEKTHGLVLPLIPYGQTWSLQYAPGSIHIDEDILVDFLFSIVKSLENQNVKMAIFVTTHFGNSSALKRLARKAYEIFKIKILYFSYPGLSEIKAIFDHLALDGNYLHAEEIETSLMLHINPELVNMNLVRTGQLSLPKDASYTPKRWTEFMDEYILGDASLSTADKGEKAIKVLVEKAVEIILKELNND